MWLPPPGVFAGPEARAAASAMQNYKYDKAIAPESKNGGSPALNNNPRKGGSKRVLLVCLDLFCLFMGEPGPAPSASRAPSPVPEPSRRPEPRRPPFPGPPTSRPGSGRGARSGSPGPREPGPLGGASGRRRRQGRVEGVGSAP